MSTVDFVSYLINKRGHTVESLSSIFNIPKDRLSKSGLLTKNDNSKIKRMQRLLIV